MENGVTLDLFLKDGMLMARAPDGSEHLYADVMRHNNPGFDFDDYTGAPLPVVPDANFPEGQAPRDNRFGDVAERYGNEELQTAKGLLGGSVNLYDALPESMQGGMMEPINRTIMDAADIGAGLLAGGYGLGQKGAAYLAEILASGTESEKRLARDMLGGFEGSGFGAEARMLGSIAEAGGRAAAVSNAAKRLSQPGPVFDTLPTPRNEAEAMAKQVLEMRAAGRAGDVTEDMMAAADPQYMFANTPLPMDEASRMARAREAGFDVDEIKYHGTAPSMYSDEQFSANFSEFIPSQKGLLGAGVYVAPDVRKANKFASAGETNRGDFDPNKAIPKGGSILPVYTRSPNPASYGEMRNEQYVLENVSGFNDLSMRGTQALSDKGFTGVRTGNEENVFDPRNIRSRFARFDPEFSHLRNLSAGIGGLGILSLLAQQDQEVQ